MLTDGLTSRTDARLEVTALRKCYGDVVALDSLDLSINAGAMLGLVGPNGAGKTTAIRCIAGLLDPDAGSVRVDGRHPRQLSKPIGVATQETELYPGLSTQDNLTFFGKLNGAADIKAALSSLVEELDLGPILSERVGSLSIGQQRLVHVAAALVSSPRLLLVDEPTAALDVAARSAVLDALARRRDLGTSILFSSHYLKEIEESCDDVVILLHGKVIASGAVGELIGRHGGARVEVTVDGKDLIFEGSDVAAAIAIARDRGSAIEAVRVVPPSLEAVFLSLADVSVSEMRAS